MTDPGRRPALREERGFTLIEVLAAMMVLLVGVLGTVSLIDGANATTSVTKGREGATNLARELVEMTRSLDYDLVNQSDIAAALKAKPGLADDDGATAGWQITRRGIKYTVTASACTFDDQTDNAGTHDGTFCSNSATTPSGDSNPDDYRRVTFDVTWKDRNNQARKVSLTGVLLNPSGGLGPRITSFTTDTPVVTSEAQSSVHFEVSTTSADAVHWSADDGSSQGNAAGGPTSWSFDWQLGTVGSFACDAAPTWKLDGHYVVSAQAFDARGIPGDLRTKTITVDRSAAAPPCGLAGGRNDRWNIVDLQWLANRERDIVGYEVYREPVGSETGPTKVCSLTTQTFCYDSDPPDSSTYPTLQYYVVAMDGSHPGTRSPDMTISQGSNQRPDPPSGLTVSIVDGYPTLNWMAASDPDAGDGIQFYRIYRDGDTLDKRYDVTSGPVLSYTDKTDSISHSYSVTAVDNEFNESDPVGPVTP